MKLNDFLVLPGSHNKASHAQLSERREADLIKKSSFMYRVWKAVDKPSSLIQPPLEMFAVLYNCHHLDCRPTIGGEMAHQECGDVSAQRQEKQRHGQISQASERTDNERSTPSALVTSQTFTATKIDSARSFETRASRQKAIVLSVGIERVAT